MRIFFFFLSTVVARGEISFNGGASRFLCEFPAWIVTQTQTLLLLGVGERSIATFHYNECLVSRDISRRKGDAPLGRNYDGNIVNKLYVIISQRDDVYKLQLANARPSRRDDHVADQATR